MNIEIGNTPLVEIQYSYKGKPNSFFAKLEYYSLTGSTKDRVAYYIIERAHSQGILHANMPIVEATSGNTGIALSAIGTYYKHPVYIFIADWVSNERFKIMQSYGATIIPVTKKEGGFKKAIELAKTFALENNAFSTNQFENPLNVLAHYETTANEILSKINCSIGGFVSGVGTGGTLMGIGKRLKENNPNTVVTALEPDAMPLLSQNKIIGNHKIEGIGDDFIPAIIDMALIDKVITINDEDAINMSRKLAKSLGLGVGISAGANTLGAILLSEQTNGKVVTIFPDDNKKYLSTDLSKPISINEKLLSNQITLDYFTFLG